MISDCFPDRVYLLFAVASFRRTRSANHLLRLAKSFLCLFECFPVSTIYPVLYRVFDSVVAFQPLGRADDRSVIRDVLYARHYTCHAVPDSCHQYTLGQVFRMSLQPYGDIDTESDPGLVKSTSCFSYAGSCIECPTPVGGAPHGRVQSCLHCITNTCIFVVIALVLHKPPQPFMLKHVLKLIL